MEILKNFFSVILKVFSWRVLSAVGSSYLSTFTMVVPFIGYLIFFGSVSEGVYVLDFSKFGMATSVETENSFMKLKMTYVGLSLIGFSTIVFKMFCPAEISSSSSYQIYLERNLECAFPTYVRSLQAGLLETRWYDFCFTGLTEVSKIEWTTTDDTAAGKMRPGGVRTLRYSEWMEQNRNDLNLLYHVHHSALNFSKFFLRLVIFVGYSFGFILTLIPSLMIFRPIALEVFTYLGF